MGKRANLVLVIGLATSTLGARGMAEAQPIAITRWTVDGGGGGWVQNGAIVLAGTAGQPDAGILTGGRITLYGGFWVPGAPQPVGVDDAPPHDTALPLAARIEPLAPNPFVHRTRIAFELPEPRAVRIEVFDVAGALQRTLADGTLPPGRHSLEWDGADATGHRVRAGLYFVRIGLGDLRRSQKVIVLR